MPELTEEIIVAYEQKRAEHEAAMAFFWSEYRRMMKEEADRQAAFRKEYNLPAEWYVITFAEWRRKNKA